MGKLKDKAAESQQPEDTPAGEAPEGAATENLGDPPQPENTGEAPAGTGTSTDEPETAGDDEDDGRIDRNTPAPKVRTRDKDGDDYEAHAAEFLLGNILTIATRRFKYIAVPWLKMTEAEQSRLLKDTAVDLKPIIQQAVQIIKDHGRIQFPAECKQVLFKGERDVVATLNLVPHAGAHALADHAGRMVTIVIEEYDELLQPGEEAVKGTPEQGDLLQQVADHLAAPAAPPAPQADQAGAPADGQGAAPETPNADA